MGLFGGELANLIVPGTVIFFRGDLGVGKTTLCRSIIEALGYEGRVKSPTYTLVEPYLLKVGILYHFDLYRLAEPSELEYVGYRDYFNHDSICLVEWPERGAALLTEPDLDIEIQADHAERKVVLTAMSECGRRLLTYLVDT
ncbi:MAG: tRNA (adenosine(37)-N6)-threonylcarbamoyltransferase complex ATPase subunit type 1 TsaE [Pseudomonadales bacterium]|nr:tRNA (adenosine(37)-N6)-threonylcarbamoyltransferase complex ATPase subunit type 1 TsaE [Pseudomonadales bacterium]